jgi:hypothetical protein
VLGKELKMSREVQRTCWSSTALGRRWLHLVRAHLYLKPSLSWSYCREPTADCRETSASALQTCSECSVVQASVHRRGKISSSIRGRACVAGFTGWTSKSSSLLMESPEAHSRVILCAACISNARIGVGGGKAYQVTWRGRGWWYKIS